MNKKPHWLFNQLYYLYTNTEKDIILSTVVFEEALKHKFIRPKAHSPRRLWELTFKGLWFLHTHSPGILRYNGPMNLTLLS